jgi:hypothetical protein
VALEKLSASKAMGNAGTATVTNVTVTVTGITTFDGVLAMPSAAPVAGLAVGVPWASAANEITVPLVNPTAAQIAAGTMTFTVIRYAFTV